MTQNKTRLPEPYDPAGSSLNSWLADRTLLDRMAIVRPPNDGLVDDRCPFLGSAATMSGPYIVRCRLPLGHVSPHNVYNGGGCLPGPWDFVDVPIGTPSLRGHEGDSLWDLDEYKRSHQGPPTPAPLPFEVDCPKHHDGHLFPRRARRTGDVFWGCSNYPKCDYATNFQPLGGVHDVDDGPLARKGEVAICLVCGSTSDVGPDDIAPGERYAGGPADTSIFADTDLVQTCATHGVRLVGSSSRMHPGISYCPKCDDS